MIVRFELHVNLIYIISPCHALFNVLSRLLVNLVTIALVSSIFKICMSTFKLCLNSRLSSSVYAIFHEISVGLLAAKTKYHQFLI